MTHYTDFIGNLGIENTPPAGIETVKWWIKNANITHCDTILDLACSTGFSSINISNLTSAKSIGIDISNTSISAALEIAKKNKVEELVNYQVGDACQLPFDNNSFSRIIVGSVFGFIENRDIALNECNRVLDVDGLLCVSSFYFLGNPPEQLLKKVNKCIGYTPDANRDYSFWNSFFGKHFSFELEDKILLPVLNDQDLENEVNLKLNTSLLATNSNDFDTLLNIRRTLNELRNYQGVVRWICKKKKANS